jgi:hypothetical protein
VEGTWNALMAAAWWAERMAANTHVEPVSSQAATRAEDSPLAGSTVTHQSPGAGNA